MFNKKASWGTLKHVLSTAGVSIASPLFHSTSIMNAEKILAQGFKARAGGPHNDAYHDNSVCFTRNLDFSKRGDFGSGQVIFILDRTMLANRFHLYGYDWYALNKVWTGVAPLLEGFVNAYGFYKIPDIKADVAKITKASLPSTTQIKALIRKLRNYLDDRHSLSTTPNDAGDYEVLSEDFRNKASERLTNIEKQIQESYDKNKNPENSFEFEERVSVTPSKYTPRHKRPSEDEAKLYAETNIPARYIKAALFSIENEKSADRYQYVADDLKAAGIPVFYRSHNNYFPYIAFDSEVSKTQQEQLLKSYRKELSDYKRLLDDPNTDLDREPVLAQFLAQKGGLDREIYLELSVHPQPGVVRRLAANKEVPPDILMDMMHNALADNDSSIHRHLLKNTALPKQGIKDILRSNLVDESDYIDILYEADPDISTRLLVNIMETLKPDDMSKKLLIYLATATIGTHDESLIETYINRILNMVMDKDSENSKALMRILSEVITMYHVSLVSPQTIERMTTIQDKLLLSLIIEKQYPLTEKAASNIFNNRVFVDMAARYQAALLQNPMYSIK